MADAHFVQLVMDLSRPGMKRHGLARHDAVECLRRDLPHMGHGADEAFWIAIAFEIWAHRLLNAPTVATPSSA